MWKILRTMMLIPVAISICIASILYFDKAIGDFHRWVVARRRNFKPIKSKKGEPAHSRAHPAQTTAGPALAAKTAVAEVETAP